MGLQERILGSNLKGKVTPEKLTSLAKKIDIATIVAAYVLGGLFPPLVGAANATIQFSAATLAGAELVDVEIKKRKK